MERVSVEPPFIFTGLDFAGPLYVRSEEEKVSSQSEGANKVFVCLFTCASTRAVHLELTQGLSVKSFLMTFRRFVSRRGLPSMLISFLWCKLSIAFCVEQLSHPARKFLSASASNTGLMTLRTAAGRGSLSGR